MSERYDDHHPFHEAIYWKAYEPAKKIREGVIARRMARTAHNLLHYECSPVPPLSYPSLCIIARGMANHYDDVFEGIDDFSFMVEEANEHPKARPGEIARNNLAVEALRLQIPIIREGLTNSRQRILLPGDPVYRTMSETI